MFFDGKVGSNRNISLGGKKAKIENTKQLVQETRRQREERELLKRKNKSITTIGSFVLKKLLKIRFQKSLRTEFDILAKEAEPTALQVWKLLQNCIHFYNRQLDFTRLEYLLIIVSKSIGELFHFIQQENHIYHSFSFRMLRFMSLCMSELPFQANPSIPYATALYSMLHHIVCLTGSDIQQELWKLSACCQLLPSISHLLVSILHNNINNEFREVLLEMIGLAFSTPSLPLTTSLEVKNRLNSLQKVSICCVPCILY